MGGGVEVVVKPTEFRCYGLTIRSVFFELFDENGRKLARLMPEEWYRLPDGFEGDVIVSQYSNEFGVAEELASKIAKAIVLAKYDEAKRLLRQGYKAFNCLSREKVTVINGNIFIDGYATKELINEIAFSQIKGNGKISEILRDAKKLNEYQFRLGTDEAKREVSFDVRNLCRKVIVSLLEEALYGGF